MKKHYLLLSAALLVAGAAHAQGTELFFSEYDEGSHASGTVYGGAATPSSGNERALEVFNPTTSTVSLAPYSVRRYSNGSQTVVDEERLMRTVGANTLPSRAAFVYANGEATLPIIRNAANQFGPSAYNLLGPNHISGGGAQTGNVAYFNGNDAVALVRYPSGTAGTGTGIIIDMVGVVGQNPPNRTGTTSPDGNWRGTNALDPIYPGTTFIPEVVSENMSLTRRISVSKGMGSATATTYGPAYLAIYELDSPDVLVSEGWAKAVEAGRWPSQVRPYTKNRRHVMRKLID